ncbi:MAG: DUF362 domain-containing protein [Desulfosudaceae bacterium]
MHPADESRFPLMALVRQSLPRSALTDVPAATISSLRQSFIFDSVRPGARIAVAVGSRGIGRLAEIVAACIDFLKKQGFSPFIVPAMGSHGGATAAGQCQLLAGLGISEDALQVPIAADMAVDTVGRLDCGLDVFVSRAARAADHIFVINRVKPHTKFTADRESGLAKMLAVGLGKAEGAAAIHRFAVRHTFAVIDQAAKQILAACPVLGGLAIVEDGYGMPERLETVAAADLMETERHLLRQARKMLPGIPLEGIDLLVVDRIGKNISGIGMDSNVTGRHRDITGDFFLPPYVRRIFVRDLDPQSHGNANGIGLADFTTSRLVRAMDRDQTSLNALTAISPEKAALPLWFDSDRAAIAAALGTCGPVAPENARVVRIRDTAHLETLAVSRAFEREILDHPSLALTGGWSPLAFDGRGNLVPETL